MFLVPNVLLDREWFHGTSISTIYANQKFFKLIEGLDLVLDIYEMIIFFNPIYVNKNPEDLHL